MIDNFLDILQKKYLMNEIDTTDMKTLKVNGMTFNIYAWRVKGLGHVSVMRAKGFFGLMRMETLIINPSEIELPLYSYDRIYAMGNDTLLVELYDTLGTECDWSMTDEIQKQYIDMDSGNFGTHWYDSIRLPLSIYKKGKKSQSSRLDKLAHEYFCAYLDSGRTECVNSEEKRRKAEYYVNGLLTYGGPSTDIFLKKFGKKKTEYLFKKILFGTENI